MTQANRIRLADYNRAWMTSIFEAYNNPSWAKQKAFHHVQECCYVLNGFDLRIVSKNTFNFTAAFKYEKDGKIRLQYHTHCNVYDFELEE